MQKVKTIGDCYLGYIEASPDIHNLADNAIHFGLQLQKRMVEINREFDCDLALRIGVHLGGIVCGVIGQEKPQFDVWGDTVNLAARLEHCAEPGQVLVSEAVFRATDQPEALYFDGVRRIKGMKSMRGFAAVETQRG